MRNVCATRGNWIIFPLCISLLIGLFGLVAAAETQSADMDVYSYVSPPAQEVLHKVGLSDKVMENYVVEGLQKRLIKPIDENRVYEGSKDSLRVDLRKGSNGLLINLSVRQGVSVHNMLQRWDGSQTLKLHRNTSPEKLRSQILSAVVVLLDKLRSEYNSPAYKRGSMMEER